MNNAAEIERVGVVILETEVIEKAKSFVDIAMSSAEVVDFFGIVSGDVCVSNVNGLFLFLFLSLFLCVK